MEGTAKQKRQQWLRKNGGSGICWCTLGTPKITC